MFFIMRKKAGYIVDKRKVRHKLATQVASTKLLKEARDFIKDTSLYIEYSHSEINRINRQLRNKVPLPIILEELGR